MVQAHPSISVAQARQLAVRAQGLWQRPLPARGTSVASVTRALGAVQLDTISALSRSHNLVVHARLAGIRREQIEAGLWSVPEATHFEYWSHAACLIPVENWPLYEFRRQAYRQRGLRWHTVPQSMLKSLVARVRDEGPLDTTELGGARKSNYWWDWSEAKVAAEWLVDIGELVCVRRVSWRRQYDLPERALPHSEPIAPEHAILQLLQRGMSALGVATKADLLDMQRLKTNVPAVRAGWEAFAANALRVDVEGWQTPAYVDPVALAGLDRSRSNRAVLLSPFDSLIWFRPRMQRLFGMDHRLEAYTPAAKRIYGYFAMPVLFGDRLIARVDVNKTATALQALRVTFEGRSPTAPEYDAVARALWEAAGWIERDEVELHECIPTKTEAALYQALLDVGNR